MTEYLNPPLGLIIIIIIIIITSTRVPYSKPLDSFFHQFLEANSGYKFTKEIRDGSYNRHDPPAGPSARPLQLEVSLHP